jgi:hypothetical protein
MTTGPGVIMATATVEELPLGKPLKEWWNSKEE